LAARIKPARAGETAGETAGELYPATVFVLGHDAAAIFGAALPYELAQLGLLAVLSLAGNTPAIAGRALVQHLAQLEVLAVLVLGSEAAAVLGSAVAHPLAPRPTLAPVVSPLLRQAPGLETLQAVLAVAVLSALVAFTCLAAGYPGKGSYQDKRCYDPYHGHIVGRPYGSVKREPPVAWPGHVSEGMPTAPQSSSNNRS